MIDLSSARLKLGRAHIHTQQANAILNRFVQDGFYTLSHQLNGNGRLIVKIGSLEKLPDDFAIAVGDAAHNLRSALDHIAFAFAKPTTGKEEEERIQFPIISCNAIPGQNSTRFSNARTNNLKTVPDKVISLIETLQPYHRRKWPETKFLWQIHTIDIWDKHRALLVTATRVKRSTFNVTIPGQDVSVMKTFSGVLKVDTVLATLQVQNPAQYANAYINGNRVVVPTFDVRMPKEIRGESVVTLLEMSRRFIAA